MLYVEKKGLWPVLQAARLAERFDMAVVLGEGYATEATRVLFAQAHQHQHYQLFVLHDSDPYGYNIARTLRDETRRMPGYSVEVIDLGLTLATALDMGLEGEEFSRKKPLPEGLVLTPLEQEYFTGQKTGRTTWLCRRVELNAMTAPQLVAFIEQGLQAAGVRGKVVPPENVLIERAQAAYRTEIGHMVEDVVARALAMGTLAQTIVDELMGQVSWSEARRWVDEDLAACPTARWLDGVETQARTSAAKASTAVEAAVHAALRQKFQCVVQQEREDDDHNKWRHEQH